MGSLSVLCRPHQTPALEGRRARISICYIIYTISFIDIRKISQMIIHLQQSIWTSVEHAIRFADWYHCKCCTYFFLPAIHWVSSDVWHVVWYIVITQHLFHKHGPPLLYGLHFSLKGAYCKRRSRLWSLFLTLSQSWSSVVPSPTPR